MVPLAAFALLVFLATTAQLQALDNGLGAHAAHGMEQLEQVRLQCQ